MKRIRLSILFLLILLCSLAFAAMTKTTSIVEIDPWTEVDAGVTYAGNAGDISGSYSTLLYLEIAYTDIDIQSGVDVQIEVSYGDDNWTLLTSWTTPTFTGANTFLNTTAVATDTVLDTDDAAGMDTAVGRKILIAGNEEDTNEAIRMISEVADDITLTHDLIFEHDSGNLIWNYVYDEVIPIPAAFAFVRVIIINSDANADIQFTTRISKVTGL